VSRQVLTNFSKGELGPRLHGRIDTPQYQAGVKLASNFIIQREGGLAFRPGFRFVGEAEDVETQITYIPFQFDIEQSYVLALWQASMRVLALGGLVLEDDDLEIQSVTLGATTTFELPFHEYAVGDRIYVTGVTGTTELNGQFGTVTAVPDADHVTVDIDSTGYSAFVSSTGITRVGAPPAPPPPPPPPPPAPPAPTPPPTSDGGGVDLNVYDNPTLERHPY
jgi:hypothetical protein